MVGQSVGQFISGSVSWLFDCSFFIFYFFGLLTDWLIDCKIAGLIDQIIRSIDWLVG